MRLDKADGKSFGLPTESIALFIWRLRLSRQVDAEAVGLASHGSF